MATGFDQYLLNRRRMPPPQEPPTDDFLGFVIDKMGLGDPAKPESTPEFVPQQPDRLQGVLDLASAIGIPTFDPRPGQEQRNLERFVGKPPDIKPADNVGDAIMRVLESVGSQQTGPQVTPFGMFDPRMLDAPNAERPKKINRFGYEEEILRPGPLDSILGLKPEQGEWAKALKPEQAKRVGEATSRWIQAGPGKALEPEPAVQELARRGVPPVAGGDIPANTFFSQLERMITERLPEIIRASAPRNIPEQRIPGRRIINTKTGAFIKDIPETVLPAKTVPGQSPAEQVWAQLQDVKPEELATTKLEEFLQQHESVLKLGPDGTTIPEPPREIRRSELLDWVKGRRPVLGEKLLFNVHDYPEYKAIKRDMEQADLETQRLLGTWPGFTSPDLQPWQRLMDAAENKYWQLADKLRDLTGTFPEAQYIGRAEIPGGKNYREMLITFQSEHAKINVEWEALSKKLDEKYGNQGWRYNLHTLSDADRASAVNLQNSLGENRPFVDPHFNDPKDVMAWLRTDDRTGPNGERVLFVMEMQSGWHARGSKRGYGLLTELPDGYRVVAHRWNSISGYAVADPKNNVITRASPTPATAIGDALDKLNVGRVPDAPFKSSWPNLALKRILRYAADEGYDAVAWPGSPETVAAVERWSADMLTDPTYQTIIRHYTDELPKFASEIGKPHGADVSVLDNLVPASGSKDLASGGFVVERAHDGNWRLHLNTGEIIGGFPTRGDVEDYIKAHSAVSLQTYILPLTPALKKYVQSGLPMYAMAGIDRDDEGNITFSPERALAGMAVGAGIKRIDTSRMSSTLQKLLGMYQDIPTAVKPSASTRLQELGTKLDGIIYDDKVGLKQLQETAARDIGRTLNANEMPYHAAKRHPDMSAHVAVQEGLQKPVIQFIGEQDEPLLATYLTLLDNIDVAEAMGRRVESAELGKELRIPGTATLKKAQQRVNYWAKGVGSKHPDATKNLASATKSLTKAQAKFDAAKLAAESKRAATAKAKGGTAEAARQFSTDINVAESRASLKEFPSHVDPAVMAKITEAARRTWQFNDGIRDYMLYTELWPDALVHQLRDDYPHFVPTRIIDYMDRGSPGTAVGKGISVLDQGIRANTIEGTARIREDPLVSSERAAYQAVALGMRNQTFNYFMRMRDASATLRDSIKVYRPDIHNARMLGPDETSVIGPGEELVTGYRKGIKTQVVMPSDVVASMNMQQALPDWARPLEQQMALFKMLLTSRNPAFIPINLSRDIATTLVGETVRANGPQHVPEVIREIIRMIPDAFAGITTGTYHGVTADVLAEGGGMHGYFSRYPKRLVSSDLQRNEEEIVRRGKERIHALANPEFIGIRTKDGLITALTDIAKMKPVEAIGERLEIAIRLPGQTMAQRRGENRAIQLSNFRTASGLDFNESGTLTRILNVFFPFFNVGVQASKFIYRRVVEATEPGRLPASRWGRVATGLTLITVPTILVEGFNRRNAETSAIYDDIPQAVKDRSVVVVIGKGQKDKYGNQRPVIWYIPTGELSPIVVLTRAAMGKVYNAPGRTWEDLVRGVMRTLSPLGDQGFDALLMPFFGTGLQLAANKNLYSGNNIAGMAADDNASRAAKAISVATSKIPTANSLVGRPSQVEFAMRDALGGLGKAISQVSDVGVGKQTLPGSIPVLGTAVGGVIRGDIGGNLERAQAQRLGGVPEQTFRNLGLPIPGEVGHEINGVPLTVAERARYQELFNKNMKSILARIGSTKAPLTPSAAQSLGRQIDTAREMARNAVYRSITESERQRRKKQVQEQLSVRGTIKGIIGK